MLTSLELRNFKTWRNSGNVKLAPVTLLLGANSTGKSSLIQSLLLLKQTIASPDRSIHLNLGGDEVNDYFNFGRFDDILTKKSDLREFEISFGFSREQLPAQQKMVGGTPIEEGKFRAIYAMASSGAPVVQQCLWITSCRSYRAVRKEKGAYSIFVDNESLPRGKSRSYAPERSISMPAEAIKALGAEGGFLEDLSLAIRREIEGIAYLGPLRRRPERDYVWNKTMPGDLGVDGNGAINALFASNFFQEKGANGDIIGGVSRFLKRMGIADKVEVRQLGHSTRYEIVVHRDGVAANLRDVGIGVSQVLPVLTLAFFASPGTTILLEEPEIHLHPLAQSVLAELFVEVSRKRKVQFIVETHSEHLFRRMQTLVAREKAKPKDCQLYFVKRKGADAELTRLELDDFGRLTNWPEKFFGDALGETREQARLMFERQKKERQG